MKKNIIVLLFCLSNLFAETVIILPDNYNSDLLYVRTAYILQYNEKYEIADWVAYELTRNEVMSKVKRINSFREDLEIVSGSSSLEDYKHSGYDRGHLAPCADMKMTKKTMSESFLLSNIAPQVPKMNQGIWEELESCIRTWAYENGSVYVITGPIITDQYYNVIGANKVAVPDYYFKVILSTNGSKGIGFIIPNRKIIGSLKSLAVNIDFVEEFTGLNFFPLLPDEIENSVEGTLDISQWKFKRFNQSTYIRYNGDGGVNAEIANTEVILYWINSKTNVRHNAQCKWYGKTKEGYHTSNQEGKTCGSCGG